MALADPIPNAEAIALSPTIGWLMLAAATAFALICVLHRETWRRFWLRAEDPRSVGLFRIAFGLVTLANINGLWELFTYLFTDEGMFATDIARQVFAASQFEGFGDGLRADDPYGFFGWGGFVQFLKGPKYSLLFFWDSPTAWWIHWGAFQLACVAFIVGYKTRYAKWLTLLLFHSIILRNQVFWEGTENVYRCFLFYLCLSRCGAAYSVDNWLRCRRLRREGRLSERGGPGDGAGVAPSKEHPRGLEAIYRLIPAWPRMLMILQTAALYCYTGVVKNGPVWAKGDAMYYALNLDHFYRFEPQQLSALFGTNLFRLSTWITHYWEACFPVVILGLVIRFHRREKIPPLVGWQAWAHRLLWIAFGLLVMEVVLVAFPVHWPAKPPPGVMRLEEVMRLFAVSWLGGMAVIGVLWRLLSGKRVLGVRFPSWLSLDTACTWLMGRRLWLGLGVIFHSHLMVMMNIGWFTPATVSTYIAFLNGSEIAHVLRQLGIRLARLGVPGIPKHVRDEAPITPAEDRTLPHLHRDAAALPPWALLAGIGAAVGGVFLALPREAIDEAGKTIEKPGIHWAFTGVGIAVGLAIVGYLQARRHGREQLSRIDPFTGKPRRPWAYGPGGRYLAGAIALYQTVGVAIWLLPEKDSLSTWRTKANEPFKWWLRTTQTSQGWKMFAPNPPRSNLFMKVLVTDVDGKVYDLNTDVYHPDQKPIPWLWYTRQRKINRRVVGAEGGQGSWYQKWHARWVCRDWALAHGGQEPKKVELVKVWYSIPTPEEVAEKGPYVPEERYAKTHQEKVVYTAICVDEPLGQLPDEIRARHGLPPLPADRPHKLWHKERWKKWEQKSEQLRERGRDPDRFPWIPLGVIAVLVAFGWRWRELDRENKDAATRAGE
ncbi:MAG: hypothetical protein H6711_22140 [Myxococcales bacterium]|nr:hypothetical protein [Myxococcales bacterium]